MIVPPEATIEPVRVTVALAVTAPARVAPLITGVVSVLADRVCVSVVPTIAPLGAVRDVPQAEPVDTEMPAPG